MMVNIVIKTKCELHSILERDKTKFKLFYYKFKDERKHRMQHLLHFSAISRLKQHVFLFKVVTNQQILLSQVPKDGTTLRLGKS